MSKSAERLLIKKNLVPKEWMAVVQKAKKYDPAEGDTFKYSFSARAPDEEPMHTYRVLYWGRDGWRKGYIHAMLTVERVNGKDNVFNLYLERENDKRAQTLTATHKKTRAWINDAINNADDKDRQEYDYDGSTL